MKEGEKLSRILAILALFSTFLMTACESAHVQGREFLDQYFASVQAQTPDDLKCMLTGADQVGQDGSFSQWLLGRYESYLDGRDEGEVPFHPDGITLVKTFALGKGTWYELMSVRESGPYRIYRTEIRFAYDAARWERFSPGTTVYLAAAPPGAVEPVTIPYQSKTIQAEVLKNLQIDWFMERVSDRTDCEQAWTLTEARVVDESIETEKLQWRF